MLPLPLLQLVLLCSVPWWGMQKSVVSPGGDCRLWVLLLLVQQSLLQLVLLLQPAETGGSEGGHPKDERPPHPQLLQLLLWQLVLLLLQ